MGKKNQKMFFLVSNNNGDNHIIKNHKVTLGRSINKCNNINLEDLIISRLHAKFVFKKNKSKLYIIDLNSTNGTFVNDKKITTPRLLKSGDDLIFGDQPHSYKIISKKHLYHFQKNYSNNQQLKQKINFSIYDTCSITS